MQRNTGASWLNETPLPSPKHIEPTVHHYYNTEPSKKSNILLFCVYVMLGILLMYIIHCLYTIPEKAIWSDYVRVQNLFT